MAERLGDQSGGHEHGGLGEGVRDHLEHAAGQGGGLGTRGQREDQEEIADLGDGRVGDQQLEPRLPQGDEVAEEDRPGTQPTKDLGRHRGQGSRHDIEPEPQDQEEGRLDDQCREDGAGGGRRPRVGRRQPEMQRKERGLGQQPDGHQRGGGDDRRWQRGLAADPFREEGDIQGGVGTVKEYRAKQVEHRAQQGEEQIAQGRRQGLGTAIQGDQGHRGKGQEFQGNEQREQVLSQKGGVESGPDTHQEHPEHERGAGLGRVWGNLEFPLGIDPHRQDHHRREEQHDGRESIRL